MAKTRARKNPDPITPRELFEAHRWFQLDELERLPGNPNNGDEASLAASLEAFGWMDGIVVIDGRVIAGNHRLDQAAAAGEEGLPGYDLSGRGISDGRALAMAIAHNRTNRAGADDPELLGQALATIETLDPRLLSVASAGELRTVELSNYARAGGTVEGALGGTPDDEGLQVEQQFAIVVEVETEAEQEAMFRRLSGEGLRVRVLTV